MMSKHNDGLHAYVARYADRARYPRTLAFRLRRAPGLWWRMVRFATPLCGRWWAIRTATWYVLPAALFGRPSDDDE